MLRRESFEFTVTILRGSIGEYGKDETVKLVYKGKDVHSARRAMHRILVHNNKDILYSIESERELPAAE